MEICCGDVDKWDAGLKNQPGVSFAQSAMWARLLAEEDKEVEILQAVEGGVVCAQALVVYTKLPFGWRYAFCPKGPVIKNSQFSISNFQTDKLRIEDVYSALRLYFNKQKCIFFRFEPAVYKLQATSYKLKQISDVNPSATTILNLQKTEQEILAGMHEKTRYNIRLAEKKGVTVREEKSWDIFWNLMRATGERDGFRLHDQKHYEHIWGSSFSHQITAYVERRPVATAVFVGFGDTFTYLYGASDYECRQFMAPYLVQWAGIQMGKNLGYVRYDSFGIAPQCHSERSEESLSQTPVGQRSFTGIQDDKNNKYKYDPKHQYAGVTRFKLGFGGVPTESLGTFDLILSRWRYMVYGVLRKLRRLF